MEYGNVSYDQAMMRMGGKMAQELQNLGEAAFN